MELRTCVSCDRELPESEFTHPSNGGRVLRCKQCKRARRVKLSSSALESHLKRVATVIRHRAKKQGVECTITSETLLAMWKEQDGKCALSGAPLTHQTRGDTSGTRTVLSSPTNVSVDRINPSGPYSRENTQLVCANINIMRRNMPLDEFTMWCRLVAETARRGWTDGS